MKTRYTIFYFALMLTIFTACSGDKKSTTTNKKEELKTLKTELHELKTKITILENALKEENTTDDKSVKVKAITLEQAPFVSYADLTGNVQSDDVISITPEASGNITDILVSEGDKVKKGEILAKLNTKKIVRDIQELKLSLALANTKFEKQEILWKQKIGSEIQYLEAKSEKEKFEERVAGLNAQLELSHIEAPFDGIVDRIFQHIGEMATPQKPFGTIVNLDNMYVAAELSEAFLNKVAPNSKVKVAFPIIDQQKTATITQVGNVINKDSRSFRIKIDITNNDHRIKPNMTAVISIINFSSDSAITVPSILVKRDFKGDYIYVIKNDKAKKLYIETGFNTGNTTVVKKGLNAGQKIISDGYAQVVDGTTVAIID